MKEYFYKKFKHNILNLILIVGITILSTAIVTVKFSTNTNAEVANSTTNKATKALSDTLKEPTISTMSEIIKDRKTKTKIVTEEKNKTDVVTVKPRTLIIKGVEIPYEAEIGQNGINANHNLATTWGGDFNPNGHTLIAGHDDGPMGIIKQLSEGDVVSVTDSDGNKFLYQFKERRTIRMVFSGRGTGYVESEDDANYILSQGSTTNLNLQTCIETRSDGYSIVFVTLTKI